ncbi:MAG: hypothetical protein K9H61_12970 [Bacteroidia bacterium]|nr:hypothetical protein [Bacteroidia bacterium]MCF8447895.1 hypothetical protein [Bacteroidia bacterium]
MKNRIEKELERNNQPYLAFYKMPDGEEKYSISNFSSAEMELVVLAIYSNPILEIFLQGAINIAKEINHEEKLK